MADNGFAHPEYLVETEWLAAHLNDPDLVVLDCTTHLIPDPKITYVVKSGREDYEKGHIPGAQFLDLQADLSDNEQLPLRFMLPKAADFAAAMRRFGISDTSRVVTYSTANGQWATRVWWVLRVFGFDNAAVLNGGFQKWANEGRPVEIGAGTGRKPGSFRERPAKPLMVDKDEVLAAIGDGASCTINALQAPQHAGSGGNTYGRPGRIAGSVNVPTVGLVDPASNAYLPPAALRAQFDKVGAFDKRVITYCGGGIAASATRARAGHAGPPGCAALRCLDVGMGQGRQPADGSGLIPTPIANLIVVQGREPCLECPTFSNQPKQNASRPGSPSPKGRSITRTASIILSMCGRANSTDCGPAARPNCCAKTPARATAPRSIRRGGSSSARAATPA
jgi:thiosulfate/3-mercaptopyruvate sulfurtransferase